MSTNTVREELEEAFKRIRGMDAALNEQLQAFSESARQRRPEFAAAIDRLIERLRQNGAGQGAPKPGDPMPPFHLPDENVHMVGLEELLAAGPLAVTFHTGEWRPYYRIYINTLSAVPMALSAE